MSSALTSVLLMDATLLLIDLIDLRGSHANGDVQEPLLPFEPHIFMCGRGRKKHINFFNINFLAPTRSTPIWAPRKKFIASFPGKGRTKGAHINFFGGIFGAKKGVPNGPFWATKSKVDCSFPALMWCPQLEIGTGKRGHYERGLFTIGISRIPKFSNQRIAKGAGKKVPRENCRKVSKNFLTLFDDF